MKKSTLLILLFSCFLSQAQIVNIPDAVFKAKLLAANTTNTIATGFSDNYIKIDTNNDGEIQVSEALLVKKLSINQLSTVDPTIANLDGITNFTNLEWLDFSSNHISSFDLHGLSHLTFVGCSGNPLGTLDLTYLTGLKILQAATCQLTSINVAGSTNLEALQVQFNQLTNINLTGLTHIINLECRVNLLSSLNVNQLTTLHAISCGNNNLSSLNVSNLTQLENFQFEYNQLTSIDISHNPQIYSFDCSYNQLTSIDVSHQPNLQYSNFKGNLYTELDFSGVDGYISGSTHTYGISDCPNLAHINIKNGRTDYIYFSTPYNCPNLHYICSDESEIQAVATAIQQAGITNLQLNTYCSFVPGGEYNTITGHITIDTDNNGCDENDTYSPNIRVNITNGANTGVAFTDASGNYTFYTLTGNNIITPVLPYASYFTISPPTATLVLGEVDSSPHVQSFCITPIGHKNDVDIVIIPTSRFRAGFDCSYRLVYKNKGNQIISGNINFAYDDAVLDFISAVPALASQSTNNLNWNYSNLMPFESRAIDFTMSLNGPTDTPAVNIGDVFNFTATINPIPADETPADNVFTLQQAARGAFDPNDKICLEGTTISTAKVGDYLNYVINFQNTGNEEAENIVVKDVIDTTKFDINTLQLITASHPQRTRITNNNVEFIFQGINLPAQTVNEPASHGYVAFKIKTKSNLVIGNTITNKASIYFDYNFPIITNIASTTVTALSVNEFEDASVSIYPNPVKNLLSISAKDNITSVQLFDVQGRLISAKLNNASEANLDLSQQAAGVYFIKVYTEKGMKVQKVIKD